MEPLFVMYDDQSRHTLKKEESIICGAEKEIMILKQKKYLN
jgi:hypothetical protein